MSASHGKTVGRVRVSAWSACGSAAEVRRRPSGASARPALQHRAFFAGPSGFFVPRRVVDFPPAAVAETRVPRPFPGGRQRPRRRQGPQRAAGVTECSLRHVGDALPDVADTATAYAPRAAGGRHQRRLVELAGDSMDRCPCGRIIDRVAEVGGLQPLQPVRQDRRFVQGYLDLDLWVIQPGPTPLNRRIKRSTGTICRSPAPGDRPTFTWTRHVPSSVVDIPEPVDHQLPPQPRPTSTCHVVPNGPYRSRPRTSMEIRRGRLEQITGGGRRSIQAHPAVVPSGAYGPAPRDSCPRRTVPRGAAHGSGPVAGEGPRQPPISGPGSTAGA